MKKQTPAFVYGTLREGFRNYARLLEGNTTNIEQATLEGFEMYSVHDSFPAILPAEGTIVGELITIKEEIYDQVLRNLDRLEGYNPQSKDNSMYLREKREVITSNGEKVEAYVYIWNESEPRQKVESGDWKQFVTEISAAY